MDNLYQEIILDHFNDPRNFGEINKKCHCGGLSNPMCGDNFEMSVCVKGGIIKEVKFYGKGCAISTAGVSMLLEKIKGMYLAEAKKISYEEIEKMLGVSLSYSRKKCAFLGLNILKQILL